MKIKRKQHVVLTQYSSQILDLYVTQKLSINKTVMMIRETLPTDKCIRPVEVASFLKAKGVLRSFQETIRFVHQNAVFESVCVGCKNSFETRKAHSKYCKTCAPSEIDVRRLANYGLTRQQFLQLLEKQNHACALCDIAFVQLPVHRNKDTSVIVDHDHKTGQVRGLLCQFCNVTVGYIEKRPFGWLNKMQNYLERAI